MSERAAPQGARARGLFEWLEPAEQLDEVLFGLIMTLTFTLGSSLTAQDGPEGVHQLLLAALGCNVAWGLIDAVMCVMGRLSERTRRRRLLERIQQADGPAALELIRGELDGALAPVSEPAARERFYASVSERLRGAEWSGRMLRGEDLKAGLAAFLLVFGATFPAVLPFFFLSDKFLALRASNAVLLLSIFSAGWRWAGWIGAGRLATASAMAAIGLALVGASIALGG